MARVLPQRLRAAPFEIARFVISFRNVFKAGDVPSSQTRYMNFLPFVIVQIKGRERAWVPSFGIHVISTFLRTNSRSMRHFHGFCNPIVFDFWSQLPRRTWCIFARFLLLVDPLPLLLSISNEQSRNLCPVQPSPSLSRIIQFTFSLHWCSNFA